MNNMPLYIVPAYEKFSVVIFQGYFTENFIVLATFENKDFDSLVCLPCKQNDFKVCRCKKCPDLQRNL